MFASGITKLIEFPDGMAEVRKLSAKSLRLAAEAKQRESLASSKELGPEMLRAFRETSEKVAKTTSPAEVRYAQYDREIVLQKGICTLTKPGTNAPVKATQELLDDLDEETALRLHREILDLSLPPLDPAEAEEKLAKS